MKRIAIIDGNSLINRAYYAMRNAMITKEGIFTQGVFGFINMLEKIRRDYEPEYMAIAFDMKAPTFRHREYQDYKDQLAIQQMNREKNNSGNGNGSHRNEGKDNG